MMHLTGTICPKLRNPAICTPSDPGISMVTSKEDIIWCSGTSVLGSTRDKLLDIAVQSCEQSDYRPKPNNHFSRKDLNCPNEKKKKESWQASHPKEAAASDDRSHLRNPPQFEAAIPYLGSVIPVPNYKWLIQANLSICASLEVLKVVERLPKTTALEELLRSDMSIMPQKTILLSTFSQKMLISLFRSLISK